MLNCRQFLAQIFNSLFGYDLLLQIFNNPLIYLLKLFFNLLKIVFKLHTPTDAGAVLLRITAQHYIVQQLAVRVGIRFLVCSGSGPGSNAYELLDLCFEDADSPLKLHLICGIGLQLNRLLFDRLTHVLKAVLQRLTLFHQDKR